MITLIIFCVFLIISAAICKAVMDTVQFKYEDSIFSKMSQKKQNWFNPKISWKNKYKNNDPKQGAKFFGSTTFLVWTTDAWHFFQMIMLTSIQMVGAIPIAIIIGKYVLVTTIILTIIYKIIFGALFEFFWTLVFPKK